MNAGEYKRARPPESGNEILEGEQMDNIFDASAVELLIQPGDTL
jgi:hypothetical protein